MSALLIVVKDGYLIHFIPMIDFRRPVIIIVIVINVSECLGQKDKKNAICRSRYNSY